MVHLVERLTLFPPLSVLPSVFSFHTFKPAHVAVGSFLFVGPEIVGKFYPVPSFPIFAPFPLFRVW